MAGNAIVARLELDSKDYEKKLAQAKKNTKSFAQGGMSDFTKLATAIVSSKAAMEVFNRVVASSQTIGDAYSRTMETAKTVTSEFVYAIANADFSSFASGLGNIRTLARGAYDALDQLGNTKISYSFFDAKDRAQFREGILAAKDVSLSEDERRAGLQTAQSAYERMRKNLGTLESNTIDYLRKEIARIANVDVSDIDVSYLDKALSVDLSKDAATLRKEIIDRYDEYLQKVANVVKENTSTMSLGQYGVAMETRDTEAIAAAMASLNAEYAETKALYGILNKLTDEHLTNLAQERMAIDQKSYAMGELVTQLNEARKSVVALGAAEAKVPTTQTASGIGRAATVSPLTERIGGFAPVAVFAEGSYEAYVAAREGALEYADALAVLEAQEMRAADGLMAIGDVVGSIGGLLGEGGAAWADYVGGIISAVSSALPALEALAAAQAAAAVTKTALSPWTAIGAVAAVASVAAAMANIPKFATGGVVPGNALSGDNVLIRANSGEVVLTKQQASNIGSLLGRGGEVTFKIKGDTLVGILNNHNKIASRSYGR